MDYIVTKKSDQILKNYKKQKGIFKIVVLNPLKNENAAIILLEDKFSGME